MNLGSKRIKAVAVSALIGGAVYAVLMSLFYQFYSEEPFSLLKFSLDFIMFAVIMGALTWWGQRKK